MAWAVHKEWGGAVNNVKRELSEVVQTIARYEPVKHFLGRDIVMLRADSGQVRT
jgi:agmatine/peptidylarginine deiminase